MSFTLRALSFAALILFSEILAAEELRIATASNFTGAMREITELFEEKTAHRVLLSTGSSGKFYAQISKGAPFDLFFSADQKKPEALESDGLVVKDGRFTYAEGALVAVAGKNSGFTNESLQEAIIDGDIGRIALANPRLAPYGEAAVEALGHLNIANSGKNTFVYADNVAQVWQFIHLGLVDVGFVARSQLGLDILGSATAFWAVPKAMYTPIRQDVAWLKQGQDNSAAEAFLRFIRSPDVDAILHNYGYKKPAGNALSDSFMAKSAALSN